MTDTAFMVYLQRLRKRRKQRPPKFSVAVRCLKSSISARRNLLEPVRSTNDWTEANLGIIISRVEFPALDQYSLGQWAYSWYGGCRSKNIVKLSRNAVALGTLSEKTTRCQISLAAPFSGPLVLFTARRIAVTRKGNIMKFPSLSFFSGKRDGKPPERHSTCDQSPPHLISKRVLFIPLRSPGDQLQIVMFPAEVSQV
jgi:hypothetical protein